MEEVFVCSEDIREAAADLLYNADRDTLVRILNEEFGIKAVFSNVYSHYALSRKDAEDLNLTDI